MKDITNYPAEIVSLKGKLAAILKIESDYHATVEGLRAVVTVGRETIATLKATPQPTPDTEVALTSARGSVGDALDTLALLQVAPPQGAGSTNYKAIQQRIADLEAQVKADAEIQRGGFYVAPGIDTGQAAARAIRQKAEGDRAVAEAEVEDRLATAAVAAGNRRIDGV